MEHLYVDTDGCAVCMRARGVLKKVPELVVSVREGECELAVKAWEEGRCAEDDPEKRKAAREAKKAKALEAPVFYQRRRTPRKS